MAGIDLSEWQVPGSVALAAVDFVIIRTSHGVTEDRHWREWFNLTVAAGKPLGFYHFAEQGPTPEQQAQFFHDLTAFLTAAQVRMGWWLDAETGQNTPWVDRFRSHVQLPTCGLYATLSAYNTILREYLHFALNWLPLPAGWFLEPGWSMPDHILIQTGQFAGVDVDEQQPAQPYPDAWAT